MKFKIGSLVEIVAFDSFFKGWVGEVRDYNQKYKVYMVLLLGLKELMGFKENELIVKELEENE